LKYFARIQAPHIEATARELKKQLAVLEKARRDQEISTKGKILVRELELAARMALQSCQFMLWQQAMARGKNSRAQRMAKAALAELAKLDRDFNAFWPRRNKGATNHCSNFLRWRMADYQRSLRRGNRR